jgi:hypothetical protein
MTGQGRPQYGLPPALRWRRARSISAALVVCAGLALVPSSARAAELDVRLRIAWGGGEPTAWDGAIQLSAGTISEVVPLGFEADGPGSMQLVDGTGIRIHPRTPRSYDGCDLRIKAPADASLLIELSPGGGESMPVELPLAQAPAGVAEFPLDQRQNRLLVQRSPGDALRVTLPRDHLVFEPGEKLELTIEPNPADVAPGAAYLLAAALLVGRSEEQLWNHDQEIKIDASGRAAPVSLTVPLPPDEGVYDLRLALYPKRLTTTIVRGKPLLSRKVQLVVVAPVKTLNHQPPAWKSVLEFDPATPKWWERMTRLPSSLRLPTLPAQPVGSGPPRTRQHLGRTWVELAPAAWQAYPLSVVSPGQPHVLEIEYPSDLEQTLGISIIQPNAAGQVGPIGLDSGFDVPPPAAGHEPAVKRHRLTFWPNTREPVVLVVNRHDKRPAVFGKLNLLAGPLELPQLNVQPTRLPARTLAAYFDKPLVTENFSAAEAKDPVTGRCLDDWQTFYDGGRRMIETLQHAGYNAAVLTVACDGSAIYPSQLLQPTPKYDTGQFFESGQDPIRKDVLELYFRLCDRSGIQLVPAVQFAAPLPELEALRLAGGEQAAGLEPIGPDGRTWLARNGARRGLGVYYNAIDDRVQEAMIAVVAELAGRYGHHPSFGGIAVQLSGESYSLLPDETGSYDNATLSAFAQQAAVTLPEAGRDPFVQRAAFLHGEGEEAWLNWRVSRVSALYSRMRQEVARQRGSAKLYLATGELLGGRQVQLALRPTLPARTDPALILRMMGLDLPQLASEGIVVPRPQRIVPAPIAAHDLHEHWNRDEGLSDLFRQDSRAAGLHFLEPAPLRLPEFDAASPFGADKTHTWFVAQIPPAGPAYRQRFAESLAALDAPAMFDGGWLLPLGQEEELAPLAKVYRRLPADAFSTVAPSADAEQAPAVVVRRLQRGGKTYFYAVSTAPWPAHVSIDFDSTEPLQILPYADERTAETNRTGQRTTWSVQLEPFDMVGGEIGTEQVTLAGYRITPPAETADYLRDQIRTVRLRANALRSPTPANALANPSFETAGEPQTIPSWVHARGPGIKVELQRSGGYRSPGALHVVSQAMGARPAPVVWIRSEPFPAPTSGRLSLFAWIRTADATRQPMLRLAVEGKLDGRVKYWKANVGASENGQPINPLSTEWGSFRFPVTDLPQAGLTDLRIGFDLMGEGEIWIDQVQVFDLWFEENERDELLKSIATANVQTTGGQLFESQQFLGSYWPSFLRRHIEIPEMHAPGGRPGDEGVTGNTAGETAAAPAEKSPPRPPSMVEKVRNWLPRSLQWR